MEQDSTTNSNTNVILTMKKKMSTIFYWEHVPGTMLTLFLTLSFLNGWLVYLIQQLQILPLSCPSFMVMFSCICWLFDINNQADLRKSIKSGSPSMERGHQNHFRNKLLWNPAYSDSHFLLSSFPPVLALPLLVTWTYCLCMY